MKAVDKYIIDNEKRPPQHSKDEEIKKLGMWISTQQKNYAKNENIMKDEKIRKIWEEFITKHSKLFQSNDEMWIESLKAVDKYITDNGKRPSNKSKDEDIKKLGSWIGNQQKNYAKNEQIMKDENIRKIWEEFTTKYSKLFQNNDKMWIESLKAVDRYIIDNGKRPSCMSKDEDIKKLGTWISHQQENYAKNEYIMKDEKIRKIWEEFATKYSNLFK
jgi:polyhydroxyalkanoate synthesis regulator protein